MITRKKFLTAEWRKLIMANYSVDPAILTSFIPANTELDLFNGKCYVSLVGFMFLQTKVMGLRVPFHTNFPEVNLRFYVRHRRNTEAEWKRGVVFIREIVPKRLLSLVANTLFNEHYLTMPMNNRWSMANSEINIRYNWKKKNWNTLEVFAAEQPNIIKPGSEEEFITEHYWGYSAVDKQRTGEYQVEHPKWQIYPVSRYNIDCDFGDLYGNIFSPLTGQKPESVFLAEGSPIAVYKKRLI